MLEVLVIVGELVVEPCVEKCGEVLGCFLLEEEEINKMLSWISRRSLINLEGELLEQWRGKNQWFTIKYDDKPKAQK